MFCTLSVQYYSISIDSSIVQRRTSLEPIQWKSALAGSWTANKSFQRVVFHLQVISTWVGWHDTAGGETHALLSSCSEVACYCSCLTGPESWKSYYAARLAWSLITSELDSWTSSTVQNCRGNCRHGTHGPCKAQVDQLWQLLFITEDYFPSTKCSVFT